MSAPQGTDRARVLRRRHRRERQALVFGVLVAGLAVSALGAVAVFTGAIPFPLERGFTTADPNAGQETPIPPCPPDGTLPVPYQNIQVTVLNATRRAGLATETANALAARGFTILTTGNSSAAVTGGARIAFGAAGVGAAYTLATQVEDAILVLDDRADATVDLAVGPGYVALLDPATLTLDPAVALTGPPNCLPLADVVPVPAPPAPSAAPAQAG